MDAKRPAGVCHCSIEKLCQSRTVKHSNGVLFETTSSLVADTPERLQGSRSSYNQAGAVEFSVAIKEFSPKSCVNTHMAHDCAGSGRWACSSWSLKVAARQINAGYFKCHG